MSINCITKVKSSELGLPRVSTQQIGDIIVPIIIIITIKDT